MTNTKFFAIAANMAQRGVPVMPTQGKKPFLLEWQKQATTDLMTIRAWADEYPECNAGCVAKPDKQWMLDDDDGGLAELIFSETGQRLPVTFTVRTGSGKLHYYWQQTDASREMGNVRLGGMFDAQQCDKQVIAAGSVHPNGKLYMVETDAPIIAAPDWLCAWVLSKKKPVMVTPVSVDAEGGGGDLQENLRWMVKFLKRSSASVLSQPEGYQDGYKIYVECPNAENHSSTSGVTETAVFVRAASFGFECQHGHCDGKNWKWFRKEVEEAVDLDDPRMPVEMVVDEPEPTTAVPVVAKKLYAMPESCMYGWAGSKARELQTPLGFAYPTVVTIFAGMLECMPAFIRPTLYTCLIGDVGCGKSETIKRGLAAVHYTDPEKLKWTVPGSDRGLIRIFGRKVEKKKKDEDDDDEVDFPQTAETRLLAQDELRNTISKANISGSSLPATLCTLWSQDEAGAADKSGEHVALVRLNILGALKAEDAEDFAEVFGSKTTAGLYDRFVYAIAPNTWTYNRWVATEEVRCGTGPTCGAEIFAMLDTWRELDPKPRKRLSEIALRWAYITASANHDKTITVEGMRCALEFAEWQQAIRSGFKAGLGDAADAQCTNAILAVLEAAGGWVRWKEVSRKKNWYRKFGASVLARTRDSLSKSGETIEETVEDGTGGFKRTGRLRVASDQDAVW